MFRLWNRGSESVFNSKLCNESTFYGDFMRDLRRATTEVVIESPFVTTRRVKTLLPILKKLRQKGVRITINTRDPEGHDAQSCLIAKNALCALQNIGIDILFTDNHHRKLAVIDKRILWEGSLNILSHSHSCEIMRRMESGQFATQMLHFIGINKFLK